jgi:hypothetical protein
MLQIHATVLQNFCNVALKASLNTIFAISGLEVNLMRNYLVGLSLATLILVSLAAAFQPAYATVGVQITSVQFSYTGLYMGAYIMSGNTVTITVKLQNTGSQQATFIVCPEQKVAYNGGGTGDNYGLMCNSITLGPRSSGTVTMPRMARTTYPGWLLYRIHVFNSAGSHSVDLATSSWYNVVIIIP